MADCKRDRGSKGGRGENFGIELWIAQNDSMIIEERGTIDLKRIPGKEAILYCRGSYPISDVSFIYVTPDSGLCSREHFGVVKSVVGRKVEVQCYIAPRYLKKLGNDWKYEGSKDGWKPLVFQDVSRKDTGFYIVARADDMGPLTEDLSSLYGSRFKFIVRECPEDKYGVKCKKECRKCLNRGVCHPLIGSCICKPGFSGPSCENACPPDTFGSRCHLNCEDYSSGCEGVLFCLQDPYGCSCAHGYEGWRCRKVPLWLPTFAKGPKVTLQDGGVDVSFRKWDPSVDDGFTYNYSISFYRLFIMERNTGDYVVNETYLYSSSTKSRLYTQLSPGVDYQAFVIIGLLNYTRDSGWEEESRRRVPWNAKTYFDLPCLKSRRNSSLIISRRAKTMQLQAMILRGSQHNCSIIVRDYANGKIGGVIHWCKEIYAYSWDDAVSCKFSTSGLTPGGRILIEDYCENSIGRCKSVFTESFITPDLTATSYIDADQLRIKNSYIFQVRSSALRILVIENDPAVLDQWNGHLKTMRGGGTLNIDDIVDNTPGINFIRGKFDGLQDNYRTFNLTTIKLSARIYVVLQYKDEWTCQANSTCAPSERWYYQVEEAARITQDASTSVYIGVGVGIVVLVLIVHAALYKRWRFQKQKLGSGTSGTDNKGTFSFKNWLQMRFRTLDINGQESSNSPSAITPQFSSETCPDCLYDFDSKEGHCSNPDCMVAQGNLPPPPGLRTSPLGGPTARPWCPPLGRGHTPEDINVAIYDEVIPQGSLSDRGCQPQSRTFAPTNHFPEPINFEVVYDDTINPVKKLK